MKTHHRILIVALLAVAIVGVFWVKHREDAGSAPDENAPVPLESLPSPDDTPDDGVAYGTSSSDGLDILGENLPRLVDLGSTKCIPCKKMAPILEEMRSEYAGRLIVEVIDARRDRTTAMLYGIRLIPTQIFYDASGKELFRHEGFYGKEAMLAKWKELGVDLGDSDFDADQSDAANEGS
ncbi:thioredoxin family protein [Candidatus Eisenbacteria bacterium]|uniref:Thioredoxin family protein n=1 Tax=Eiseniibacteriota bacterium TaxID=2212470 RepID=A0ABV6YJ85_UNCEI